MTGYILRSPRDPPVSLQLLDVADAYTHAQVFKNFLSFFLNYVCVSACWHVYMNAGAHIDWMPEIFWSWRHTQLSAA